MPRTKKILHCAVKFENRIANESFVLVVLEGSVCVNRSLPEAVATNAWMFCANSSPYPNEWCWGPMFGC